MIANKFNEFGPGDAATWPKCAGHPHDPRTPEAPEVEEAAQQTADEIRLWLTVADQALFRKDFKQFMAAMQAAKDFLSEMDFGLPA